MAGKIRLSFMGTNGWYTTRTGNTVSALLETPKSHIVLDAGEGIGLLPGFAKGRGKRIGLFLSHFHIDHISGLHLLPRLAALKCIRIFGQPGAKRILSVFANHPFTASFPELEKIGLKVSVHELKVGINRIDGADYTVVAAPLVHADPCWGYRFGIGGKSVAYCTDTGACGNVVELSRGADALITECGLPPGAKSDPGWPHLSPESAAGLAKRAGCKRLFLTHFAAHHYPTMASRKRAEIAARRIFPATYAAKDGMRVLL